MKKEEAVGESVVIGLLVGGLSSFVYWLLLLVYDWKIWKSWCVGWWFIDSVFLGGFFVFLSCICTRKKCPDTFLGDEDSFVYYLGCSTFVGFVLNLIFGISKNVFVFEFITDKISQLWMSILLTIYSIICFALNESQKQNTASSNKESFRDGMKEKESAANKYFMDSFSEEINAAENDKAKPTLDEQKARWNQLNEEARIRSQKQIEEEKKKRQENDLASKKRQEQINAEKKRQSEIDRVFGIQKELEEGEYN